VLGEELHHLLGPFGAADQKLVSGGLDPKSGVASLAQKY
jgi:hypothetical protein